MAEEMDIAKEGTSSGAGAKLFLGGLAWTTSEGKLREYFSQYGQVEDVVVMKDRLTGQPRGFGFITFSEPEAAAKACSETHVIDGRTIDAKPSVPQGSGEKPRSKKIFVGGLAPETTDDQFKGYFSTFGTVTDAQIMVDYNSGRSRGFGFVTFEEEEAVQKVFAAGQMHTLGGKQVEVKSATPKGSGPQHHQQPQQQQTMMGRGGRGGVVGGRGYPGGRGFEQYGQQGFGMGAAFGFQGYPMPGQYGQYGYGMPYGAYPAGMMYGYGGFGQQPFPGAFNQAQQGFMQQGDSRYQPYGSRQAAQQRPAFPPQQQQ